MPFFFILLGVIGLTVYILAVALKQATNQITRINEQLLIVIGTKDGNEAVGRALVASAKLPKKDVPGIVDKKKDEPDDAKSGFKMTVGVR